MATYEEVFEFAEEGIFTAGTVVQDDTIFFRLSVETKEDFERWKYLYMERSNTCFNVKEVYPGKKRKVLHQTLVCHHAVPSVGKKKTFTG